jgi:hypothetical protein
LPGARAAGRPARRRLALVAFERVVQRGDRLVETTRELEHFGEILQSVALRDQRIRRLRQDDGLACDAVGLDVPPAAGEHLSQHLAGENLGRRVVRIGELESLLRP